MSMLLRPVLAAALFLLVPAVAYAQSPATQPPAQTTEPAAAPEPQETAAGDKSRGRGRMKACRTDAATHCADAAKGSGRRQCLQANVAKLSPECQAALASNEGRGKGKGKGGPGRKAMGLGKGEDLGKGEGRGKGKGEGRRAACRSDVQTLCAGVAKGGGGIGKCLRENVAKLSPACAEAVQSRQSKAQN